MRPLNRYAIVALLLLLPTMTATAAEQFVGFAEASFVWIDPAGACPILVDGNEDKGVLRAIATLQGDAEKVSGRKPEVVTSCTTPRVLIIGSLQKSAWIQQLFTQGKIEAAALVGKREKYIIQTVAHPLDGIDEAVVIAGSDKRGTIYGIYELSTQMGISPWYYWADVPIEQHSSVGFYEGIYTDGEPAVKYRGIFINDEWPALGRWAEATFGGFNSTFYEKVFEVILRLKGNFMWPAMWASAFYDDDPQNGALADEMGIVIGTSHHEPMCEAQQDWKRRGTGAWNYTTNKDVLCSFWREGIRRSKDWEKVVTVGMRGDGDEAMSDETNIALLEDIIRTQREIIAEETQQDASAVPQVWALYKEVQDYYDRGMRVPDDVTLLLCDDNWGNVRKLPSLAATPRQGGYGMYYHFDYVGAPRNSKWINITQIQRVWEQMTLSYDYGVRELWVVNVGDIKPMEYPITFFLDMAWNPARYDESNLFQHTEAFCRQQFGGQYAADIARLIDTYTKYNCRVTLEILNENTYSLTAYDEWTHVKDDYVALSREALSLYYLLPDAYRAAFDQLVLFPIQACANLYEMYYAVAMNRHLAVQHDAAATLWAQRATDCFLRDSLLTDHYNNVMSNGKWKHMMDQTHIGYTSWNEPPYNIMPNVEYVETSETTSAEQGFVQHDGYVSIEAEHYTRATDGAAAHWIVIPNMGRTLSAITTAPSTATPDDAMWVEYVFYTDGVARDVDVLLRFCPTLNFNDNKGLRYAVSIDDGNEQIVNINGDYRGELGQWQADHIITCSTTHHLTAAARHTLRYRPLDVGLVLQKIMIDCGGLEPSFLGPPESSIVCQ